MKKSNTVLFLFFLLLAFACNAKKALNSTNSEQAKKTINPSQIDLLTYNIWGLPYWIPGLERKKRYPKLVEEINRLQPKIVCLQECFHHKFRKKFLPKLDPSYHLFSDPLCNNATLTVRKDCYGGLVTLSQYPILEEFFFEYPLVEGMSAIEKKGLKGFLFSKLETPFGTINVINTHLYAPGTPEGEAIRLAQIKYLESTIKRLNLSQAPLFLLGDLNSVHPSFVKEDWQLQVYNYLTKEMNFQDSKKDLTTKEFTYSSDTNPYAEHWMYEKAENQKLDYFLYHLPANQTLEIAHQSVEFKDAKTFSDHYGIYSVCNLAKK